MTPLRDIPIKQKLALISLATSGIALLLAGGAFLGYERTVYPKEMVQQLSTLAEMTGSDCSAALSFNDATSAENSLKGFSAQPHVVAACVYNKEGKVFATYLRGGADAPFWRTHANQLWPKPAPDGENFGKDHVELFRSIRLDQEKVGTIYLRCDLKQLQSRMIRYVIIGIVVTMISIVIAFLVAARLHRIIADPVSHVAEIAGQVASTRNYALRAVKQGNDELGRLIDGFNEMLSQIQARDSELQRARDELEKRVEERTQSLRLEVAEREKIHGQLLEVSRRAGMAEVATGVLHNVGNVLNSVNVSANLVAEEVRHSKMDYLSRIDAMLREHASDLGAFLTQDPKGRMIPDYLGNLARDLAAEQQTIIQEIDHLQKNVQHIKDIVTMQQSYAKVSGVAESAPVAELVEDALRMNSVSLARHGVELVRDYRDKPSITVEKHKVLQVLVNLVRNAKHACDDSSRTDKRITIRISSKEDRAAIAVIDNGVGILPENLTRVFAHGFTTRKEGHGFGLHSGALAARELGGSLTAYSAGPGTGATFTLELPLQSTDPAA